jgi:hypothetical protein
LRALQTGKNYSNFFPSNFIKKKRKKEEKRKHEREQRFSLSLSLSLSRAHEKSRFETTNAFSGCVYIYARVRMRVR